MSSSVSSVFLQHLQQARQHEGTVQNKTLKSAKNTPQPTRLGPISFNSNVRKPLSPRPTNVITSPIDIIPSRVRPRFFDQVGHQTTNASIGNKYLFTK